MNALYSNTRMVNLLREVHDKHKRGSYQTCIVIMSNDCHIALSEGKRLQGTCQQTTVVRAHAHQNTNYIQAHASQQEQWVDCQTS